MYIKCPYLRNDVITATGILANIVQIHPDVDPFVFSIDELYNASEFHKGATRLVGITLHDTVEAQLIESLISELDKIFEKYGEENIFSRANEYYEVPEWQSVSDAAQKAYLAMKENNERLGNKINHLVIIDYGSGNLRSVAKAFEKISENTLTHISVANDPSRLETATHIVLPGVGAFGDCIAGLKAIPGMIDAMENAVHTRNIPFLGICVGMQLLCETGYENGTHTGLGWIKGECIKLQPSVNTCGSASDPLEGSVSVGSKPSLAPELIKIPHMGWNELQLDQPNHPLLKDITPNQHAYFVHSYHVVLKDNTQRIAHINYGTNVTAAIAQGNIMGTQFHPEKSQATGLQLLKNFMELQ